MDFGGANSTVLEVGGDVSRERPTTTPDFAGELNLVFVASRLRDLSDMDRCLLAAKQLKDGYQGLRYYELPAMGRLSGQYGPSSMAGCAEVGPTKPLKNGRLPAI